MADRPVVVQHLHLNGGRDQAERPRPQSGIQGDDMRTGAAAVVVLGAHAAGEDVLCDVDLMFFTIDVSGGTHAARRCILGALTQRAAERSAAATPVKSTV